MNNKKILAIFLGLFSITIFVWGLFNLLVEQWIYNGPTPLASILAIVLLIKSYKMYKKA